jgi:tetratricopeptide (TPR) repeat protein
LNRMGMPVVVVLIVGLSSVYFGYLEASLNAATQLRYDKKFAASASRLEAVLPYMWMDLYRSQAMLKLAFNYHDLARYDQLSELAQQLEADFPGTIHGYHGVKLQADLLLYQREDYAEAINLYSSLLDLVKPRQNQETLHGLREILLYDVAVAYRQSKNEEMFLKAVERLKMEYPASPYIAEALNRK